MDFRTLLANTPEKLLEAILPSFLQKNEFFGKKVYLRFLAYWSRYPELVKLINQLKNKEGPEFLSELFEKLDFSYKLSQKDREKIPAEGRLLVVANHPLGALDGLSLLHAILEVRPDVKMVTRGFLQKTPGLSEYLLPVDESLDDTNDNLKAIADALSNEEAVILFPSREISTLTWQGIRDGKWRHNFIILARKLSTPILPVFIQGKNSFWFYLKRILSYQWSALSLPREIIRKKGKTIELKIGHPIPASAFTGLRATAISKLLYRHLLAIARNKKGYFKTIKTVIHPVERRLLKAELSEALLLGETDDGMRIYLTTQEKSPFTIREIARLRELTFRKVGEGTGNRLDLDLYDQYYDHLVLWDDEALEIVGAYRIGNAKKILAEKGINGLYTSTLFHFSDKFIAMMDEAIELGRSFVQQKYWNSAALDYLWHGIGAYLAKNPQIRYMFGPVSISKNYSREAMDMLVFFYSKWFPDYDNLCWHKNPYHIPDRRRDELRSLFCMNDYKDDFKILKANLKHYGYTVPTLYKQYSELCEEGGVRFLDFGIDEDFGFCVDGMILVDMAKIKKAKYDRYVATKFSITGKSFS